MAKGGWTKSTHVASVRLDLDAWEHLEQWASAEGLTVNDKLKSLVDAYVHPPSKPRPPGRPTRWTEACNTIRFGLGELASLQEEYQAWLDNLPESLQTSATAEKLQEVTNLDIDSALEFVDEADAIDLPLGFGRD